MADHDELVAEMLTLEQMGTQERQKLAKKRRMQQLKKWGQREKEWIAKEKQLNRRLANILNEENNGLNLKQYTTYNSNQRTKKRLTATTNSNTNSTTNATANNNTSNGVTGRYNNGSANGASKNMANGEKRDEKIVSNINNNNLTSIDGPYANNLTPNGRVHFDVGVMLLEAAARNDYDEVKRLLTLGVSPDSINHDGLTALHQCCIDASEPIMNLLLEFGADVDARDTERWTPLHAACTCGHLNLVKILVAHDADLLAVNGDGNMPFDICEDEATLDYIESQMIKRGITQEMIDTMRASNEIQMLRELEQFVASGKGDINLADDHGVTQMHIAAANNYVSVVKLLLKHGANVNACDNDLWRPLHGVACWGNEQHIKIAELLVEGGADLDAKTTNEETVFDLCDNVDLLERLNQLKDELESKQSSGTDRLRRTQSRTNSRVHSVRRTRVQDKNQISRREAREEAMLRVESSETLNGGGQQQQQQQPQPPPSKGPPKSQADSSNHSEIRSDGISTSRASEAPPRSDSQSLAETNLDLEVCVADDKLNGHSHTTTATTDHMDHVDSASGPLTQTTRSQQEQQISNSQQQKKKNAASGDEQHLTHANSATAAYNNITTMKVSAPSSPRHVNSDILNPASPEAFSRQTNDRLSGPQATSIVQVNFTPMNYTLSNLKKHRSEVRMRTAVIGGGGGSNPTVQSDPEPSMMVQVISKDGSSSTGDMMARANGWSPSSSGAASFNKFHGEPSETIIDRRNRSYKCCTII